MHAGIKHAGIKQHDTGCGVGITSQCGRRDPSPMEMQMNQHNNNERREGQNNQNERREGSSKQNEQRRDGGSQQNQQRRDSGSQQNNRNERR